MEPNNGFNIILFDRRASADVEGKGKRMRREREKEGGSLGQLQSIKNTFEVDQKPRPSNDQSSISMLTRGQQALV